MLTEKVTVVLHLQKMSGTIAKIADVLLWKKWA